MAKATNPACLSNRQRAWAARKGGAKAPEVVEEVVEKKKEKKLEKKKIFKTHKEM
jgi:hypothetical protein